jgi:opacity protein-like surface antigen
MTRLRLSRALLYAVCLGCTPAMLAGQSTSRPAGVSIEASLVRASLSGNDFDGTDAGIGFDAALVFRIQPTWRLAAGIQRTSHDVDFTSYEYSATQFFAEPRFVLQSTTNIEPYIFGRAGYVRAAIDDVDIYDDFGTYLATGDLTQSGFTFGAGVGLSLSLAPNFRLQASASFHSMSFGDAEFEGIELDGTDASGTSMLLRGGASISFGSANPLRRNLLRWRS